MKSIKRECWTDADVKCPFYKGDDRYQRSVSCEGFAEGMGVCFKFRTLRQRERHMGVYCVGSYESCPMFRCTSKCRYGEERAYD